MYIRKLCENSLYNVICDSFGTLKEFFSSPLPRPLRVEIEVKLFIKNV